MPDPVSLPARDAGGPLGKLGRYHLQEVLGEGGFGIVYRAYDPVLERPVALKVPKLRPNLGDLIERFLREARSAARLRHPNIVTVYDCGREEEQPFIALEFVAGQTLADRLREGKPTPRQAASWIRDVALALHYAHSEAIIHRDVKPANIMLDRSGAARLTDFGLAKETVTVAVPIDDEPAEQDDATTTRIGVVLGTPAYMAPEQARGDLDNVGPASDQYSLGVVLYECLTSRRPFLGDVDGVMDQTANPKLECPPPREFDRTIPLGIEAIARKSLQKNASSRYSDLASMAVELTRWLRGDPVSAPLRLRGRLVRVCPGCDRLLQPDTQHCVFCRHDLRDLEPIDSADFHADSPAPVDAEPEPATFRDAVERVLQQLGVVPLWIYATVVLTLILVNYLIVGEPAENGHEVVLKIWGAIPLIGWTRECGLFCVFVIAGGILAWKAKTYR